MAKDPYKYFRIESRELLDKLAQGVLQLEKGTAGPDLIQTLLRVAHTLKGAARVVKQPEIAERAHTIEELLTHYRGAERVTPPQGSEMLALLDQTSALVNALDAEPNVKSSEKTATQGRGASDDHLETLRVDIPEMDELLRAVSEVNVQLGAVRKRNAAADQVRELVRLLIDQLAPRRVAASATSAGETTSLIRARSLAGEVGAGLDRLQRGLAVDVARVRGELAEIQDIAHRLRLTPARTIFPSLDRAVRDAATALGKRVDFEARGDDVRLDAAVLIALRDALAHIVRNSVAHGIESAEQRLADGKPATGHVVLDVARRGSRVALTCSDDGRGIDIEAVRRAAVERGRVSATEARVLSPAQVIELLNAGGISTSSKVTELSGRGIGLDVARSIAVQLHGDLIIRSETGRGTTVELAVPVSIASMQGLVVESDGTLVAIPLDAVRQTLRVRDGEIARSATSVSIHVDGHVMPFLPLERALRKARPSLRKRDVWSAVVVQSGGRAMALGVDRLHATSSIVLRSLPALLETDAVVSGASLDADGNPQLVLDPHGLIEAADANSGRTMDEPAATRAPILVIDDSLTTRMLEQSILQSAGYDVALAISAEDGLEKALATRYSLFIVDVEMPGMDGFEFVTRTRADPVLRNVPAILVTSRDAADDRRRGEQAGASAYIVKGEFDQGLLLRTIRQLVG